MEVDNLTWALLTSIRLCDSRKLTDDAFMLFFQNSFLLDSTWKQQSYLHCTGNTVYVVLTIV